MYERAKINLIVHTPFSIDFSISVISRLSYVSVLFVLTCRERRK